jgi:hypothetical protein
MRVSLRQVLRTFRRDESGQSLIIIVSSMAVLLGMAAFGIDTASWMVRHHQAQVVADSAALAAAHCLADPGQSGTINLSGTETTVPACSSSSDTADAQTVAVDYAAANGLTITTSNVSVNTTKDTVNVTAPAPSTAAFASMFGLASTTQRAMAEAGWSAGSSYTCSASTPSQCSAVYAGNTACPSNSSPSASQSPVSGFQDGNTGGGATPTINGVVHSEGGVTIVNSGPSFNGTPPITVAGSCYTSSNMPDYGKATEVASQPWPINYAASPYFSACTTTCTTVGGVADVPPYCTQATTSSTGYDFTNVNDNADLPVSGNVYCAIGTGLPSNPATWNGAIQIEANYPSSGCGSSYPQVTFIGGNISFITDNGGGTSICLSPDLDNCLMYSTGNVNIYNGTFAWTGNIFDPTGTIALGSQGAGGDNDSSSSGMLEGWNVYMVNATLNMTGDGPAPGSSGGSSAGSDMLLQ